MHTYTVIIEKKHCEGADYMDSYDCPLVRVIKETYPELINVKVGGTVLNFNRRVDVLFNHENWNSEIMNQLISGKIKQVEIKF